MNHFGQQTCHFRHVRIQDAVLIVARGKLREPMQCTMAGIWVSSGACRLQLCRNDIGHVQGLREEFMAEVRVHAGAGAAVAAVLILSAICGSVYAADGTPDISGTYWTTRYYAKLPIVGGGDLPLTAKGKDAYAKNQTGLTSGEITD